MFLITQNFLLFLKHYQNIKKLIFSCIPTSFLALILFLLLIYNGSSVFYINLPLQAPENFPGKSLKKISASTLMYAVKEDHYPPVKTHFQLLSKPNISRIPTNFTSFFKPKKGKKRKILIKILKLGDKSKQFPTRIKAFLGNSVCKTKFFMTWISSIESFGERELLAIESVFKYNPNSCLIIVSNSLDSENGNNIILKPFLQKGFKIISISPDFEYIFKNTPAELWFNQLKKGNVDPGEVSLGQNLSNLLRLSLLYKFGGIYLDTDVLILKGFNKLKNAIGAQTIDIETGNWSRLNNAVLIFDKKHPLLFKFIQEFSLTFNGNKWGHNGPYLVSRVVSRVIGRPGLNFTVLPPSAFYPVNWSRVRSLFRGPKGKLHSKWLDKKLEQIRSESLAVHLWNKQSRKLKVENRSIISNIILDSCIFCNFSTNLSNSKLLRIQ